MAKKRSESKFDLEKFRKYVNTYDKEKHGLHMDNTIVKDMVYGIGIALNEKEYSMADGFKKFIKHLVKIIL